MLSHFEDVLDYSIFRHQSKSSVLYHRRQLPTQILKILAAQNTFVVVYNDTQHSHFWNKINHISMAYSYNLGGDIRIPSTHGTYCSSFGWGIHLHSCGRNRWTFSLGMGLARRKLYLAFFGSPTSCGHRRIALCHVL